MDLGRSLRALGYSLWGVTVIRYETKGACVLAMVVWAGSVGLVVPRAAEPQAAPARAQAPAATPARAQTAPAAAPAAPSPSIVAATVKDYCAACHNEGTKTGGLVLTNLDPANIPADAEVWEKVIRKVRTGMMPPFGVRHPDPKTRATFVSQLSTTLDRAAAAKPNPGRPALYRLNRTEYANAIRDLLDLEVDVTSLLPPMMRRSGSTTSRMCSA